MDEEILVFRALMAAQVSFDEHKRLLVLEYVRRTRRHHFFAIITSKSGGIIYGLKQGAKFLVTASEISYGVTNSKMQIFRLSLISHGNVHQGGIDPALSQGGTTRSKSSKK